MTANTAAPCSGRERSIGQFSCSDSFTTGGTYTLTGTSAPGLGTMVVPMVGGSPIPPSTSVVNFALLVPPSEGVTADVIV